jgi:hypothetical protein
MGWTDALKPWTYPGHLVGGAKTLFGGTEERRKELREAGGMREGDIQGLIGALQHQAYGQQQGEMTQELLRQALSRNVAAQHSIAASARPGETGVARRVAAQRAGDLGAGLAGQGAVAAIAERQAALTALANLLAQQRGLDIGVAANVSQVPTWQEQLLSGLSSGAAFLGAQK